MLSVAVELVRCKKISSYEAEKQFGIPRRTILNKCKNLHQKSIGHPTKLSLEEEKHIADVINLSAEFGSPLTFLDLRIVVQNYLEKNDRLQIFDGKMPGDRWVRSFLMRHNFTQRATQNIKRCRAEKSVAEMIDFYKNLEISLENIPPQNILNFDETNLSDDPGASKAIFKRGTKHPERVLNSTKTSVSIMFAGTANGECLPPYVVYKAEHLWTRWSRDGPPNARYNRTKSGWFDMATFDEWFEFIVLPWANGLKGTKLIIGDNLSSHLSVNTIKLCQEHDIKFVFLPRNATHLTQPLDLAYFGPIKKEWRKILLQYKLSNPSVSSNQQMPFPSTIKRVN